MSDVSGDDGSVSGSSDVSGDDGRVSDISDVSGGDDDAVGGGGDMIHLWLCL